MGSIIVSLPKPENAIRIREIIKTSGFWEDVIICHHGAEILNMVDNQDVSLVICVKKLQDMGYEELVNYLPPRVGVILLTKDADLVPIASNVKNLLMPFPSEALIEKIKEFVKPLKKKEKKRRLRTPEEQQIIDDAKAKLMESRDMTEPDAFRFIQKISMDSRKSFVDVAKMILEENSG